MPVRLKSWVKKVRTRTWIALGVIALLLPILAIALYRPSTPEAAWYDDTYAYRRKITFSHGSTVTNNTVTITVDTSALTTDKMQADCDDTRFTGMNGQLLAFELVSGCDTTTTSYEVLFPSITANETVVSYIYYGNPTATSASLDLSAYTNITPTVTVSSTEEKSEGPIAYWSLNQGVDNTCDGGEDACDYSPNGYDGTSGATTAAPTWLSDDLCVVERCMRFDGTDDQYTVSNFNIPNAGTVTFWMKYIADGGQQRILGSADNFEIRVSSTDILGNELGNTGSSGLVATEALVSNTWYHVALTYDLSDDSTKIYINGSLHRSGSTATDASFTTPATLTIGNRTGSSSSDSFKGTLDEIKIYNYVRSEAQVRADYLSQGASSGSASTMGGQGQKFLSDGLVGYWKMEDIGIDAEGEITTDGSGNANSGTLNGDNSTGDNGSGMNCTAEGKFGTGCDFDGTDDYVTVADSNTLDVTPYITISAWIKPDSASGSDSGIINKTGSYELLYTNAGKAKGRVRGTTPCSGVDSVGIHGNTVLTTGVWSLVTWTYDGKVNNLYVNGILDGSYEETCTIPVGTGSVDIGRQSGYYNGKIDQARVYNRVLSPAEVQALYNWAPGPVGYWNFNEGSGQSSADLSGNGNTASLGATSGSDTTDPTWTQGKFGGGVEFDGVDDEIEVNLSSADTPVNPDGDSSFTVSTWAYVDSEDTSDGGGNFLMLEDVASSNGSESIRLYVEDGTNTATQHQYKFAVDNASGTGYVLVSGDYEDNSGWHHIAGTIEPGVLKLYVDGILVDTDTGWGTTTIADTVEAGNDWRFGDGEHGTTGRVLDGKMDEVKIYNYTRSQSQIIEDMNGGHPLGGSPVGSPLVHWRFDEQQGTTANNSGNGSSTYNGTLSGSSYLTKSEGCKVNGCVQVFSTSDTVSAGDQSFVDGATQMTISFWADGTNATDASILGKWGATNTQTNFLIRTDSTFTDELVMQVASSTTDTGSNYFRTSDLDLDNTTWSHVAFVYDGTLAANDRVRVYKNGHLVAGTVTGTIPTSLSSGTTSSIVLGDSPALTTTWIANYDEVKIYNAALTAEQVRVDANLGSSINFGGTENEAEQIIDGAGDPPVAYWPLDEKSGTSTADISGNGNTGTLTNMNASTDWVRGKYGSALQLNNASGNSYVNGGSASGIDDKHTFTWSGWFYAFTTGNNSRMLQKGSNAKDVRISSNKVYVNVTTDSTTAQSQTSANFPTNQWTHVVVTYDNVGDRLVRIYLNGVEGAYSIQTAGTGNIAADASANFIIGNSSGADREWHGYIDDIKIYDYVRTPAQIAYDYNRGGPIAHWRFDECQGATVYDSSGNGNNGIVTPAASGNTATGTCDSGTSTHMWNDGTNGKYNGSLGFDGTDDYVALPDNMLDSYSLGSICAWAYYDKSSDDGSQGMIFGYSDNATLDHKHGFYLSDTGSDSARVRAVLRTNTPSNQLDVFTSNNAFTRQSWHHYCFIQDGSGVNIYIDGGFVPTTNQITGSTSSSVWFDDIASQAEKATIGNQVDNVPDSFFTGKIDDVRIYNYALSPDQVSKIYNNGSVYFGPEEGQP